MKGRDKMNIVERKCKKCGFIGIEEKFWYLKHCVWQCRCGSKYTEIYDIKKRQGENENA
jgi:hypothetical protein